MHTIVRFRHLHSLSQHDVAYTKDSMVVVHNGLHGSTIESLLPFLNLYKSKPFLKRLKVLIKIYNMASY